jgi:selenocysteine-specific elongation factor
VPPQAFRSKQLLPATVRLAPVRWSRFILRDQSAQRTIGGGIVLDPFGSRRPAQPQQHEQQLAALATLEARPALQGLAACTPAGVDMAWFARTFCITGEQAATLASEAGLVVLGDDARVALSRGAVEAARVRILAELAAHHAAVPAAVGLEVRTLRERAATGLDAAAFTLVLRSLLQAGSVRLAGSVALLASHNATDNAGDQAIWQAIRPLLEEAGFQGLTVAELAATRRLKEAVLRDFLYRKARGGEVVRVTAERFYLSTTLLRFARIVGKAARASADGMFSAAQVRDATGIGRALAIQILERLDRLGATRRVGDRRSLHPDFESLIAGIGLPASKKALHEETQP